MSKPQIIGLLGFKRVGKSTAAEYLEKRYSYTRHNFKQALIDEIKENFPDLLKEIAKYDLNEHHHFATTEDIVNNLFETKPPLMRALMINYGTDVRRKENPDYWVNSWIKSVSAECGDCVRKDVCFVADDVRFKNEAKAIQNYDGILIRLTRDDITTGGDHASETEQLEIEADYTINCKKDDLAHLYSELDKIINDNN